MPSRFSLGERDSCIDRASEGAAPPDKLCKASRVSTGKACG
jgi:hypothetical protein